MPITSRKYTNKPKNLDHIVIKNIYSRTPVKGPAVGQIYSATLVTTQNCTKMLRNFTFVVQIAYFCIRPNKRGEKQKKFLLFEATYEQLSLQKATSDFF